MPNRGHYYAACAIFSFVIVIGHATIAPAVEVCPRLMRIDSILIRPGAALPYFLSLASCSWRFFNFF